MLALQNVNQYYGSSHTLWDINIDLRKGSCTCLMGRNGVGKTTLLKSIMGLETISKGDIIFDGTALTKNSTEKRAKLGIGYVPQGRDIFAQLTVEDNLRIGLAARRDKIRTIPERIFELFPVLKEMLHRRGGDLSGGQQQQLAIGRALTIDPTILILDEPTEGIQPNIVKLIGDVITQLNEEENITILLVEQKLPFARRVGKNFIIMDRGRSVAMGKMEDLKDELVSEYLTV